MRLLAALAALAAAAVVVPALVAVQPALPPASPAAAGGGVPARAEPCLPGERERVEEREGARVRIIGGCVEASAPPLRGGVDVRFEVMAGAERLRLQLHLHGPQEMTVRLDDPAGDRVANARGRGDASTDSFALLEVAAPEAGAWRLRASLNGTALLVPWTLVVTEPYARSSANCSTCSPALVSLA